MGSAASTVVKMNDAAANEKKEILLPLENLSGHIRVYQHSMNGEVLVLVDQSINSFLDNDKEIAEWFEVVICAKQREYFNSIKISLVAKSQDLLKSDNLSSNASINNYTNGMGDSPHRTTDGNRDRKGSDADTKGDGVRKALNILRNVDDASEDLDKDNEIDYRADDKRFKGHLNTGQSKQTSSTSPNSPVKVRKFQPTPYLPPGSYHNDMTQDVRMQHLTQALAVSGNVLRGNSGKESASSAGYFQKAVGGGGGGGDSAKRTSPSHRDRLAVLTTEHEDFSISLSVNNDSNKGGGGGFLLHRPPHNVPSKCSVCGEAFSSANIDVVEEHLETCAVTMELRKSIEEVDRALKPVGFLPCSHVFSVMHSSSDNSMFICEMPMS